MSEAHRGLLTVAIVAAGSILEETATKAAEEMRDATDWLAFFLQNGAYNSKPAPLGEFVRARQLFGVIAREPQMRDERFPLDEWMRDDYHFTIEEQFALGFALAAMSHAWDTDARAGMRSGIRAEDFDDLLSRLGMAERREAALRLISTDRATFAAEFAAAAAGTDPAHIAWETRPFMRGLPREQVRLQVAHVRIAFASAAQLEHLRGSVDGGHARCVGEQPFDPQAGAACQLQDITGGRTPGQWLRLLQSTSERSPPVRVMAPRRNHQSSYSPARLR